MTTMTDISAATVSAPQEQLRPEQLVQRPPEEPEQRPPEEPEQRRPEQQGRPRVGCRRCAEVQHGGPSCD